jgi:hypothetical protein
MLIFHSYVNVYQRVKDQEKCGFDRKNLGFSAAGKVWIQPKSELSPGTDRAFAGNIVIDKDVYIYIHIGTWCIQEAQVL